MTLMRILMFVAVLAFSTSAYAQAPSAAPAPECFPSSQIDKVAVQMADGSTRRGSLLCLGTDGFTLAERQTVGRFRLEDVREIRKVADPVWDGAAKGAAVSLVVLVLCGGNCSGEAILRSAAAYGLFGLALDAINSNTDTIYRPSAAKRVTAGFRVRF
jgi:hypothetical protein